MLYTCQVSPWMVLRWTERRPRQLSRRRQILHPSRPRGGFGTEIYKESSGHLRHEPQQAPWSNSQTASGQAFYGRGLGQCGTPRFRTRRTTSWLGWWQVLTQHLPWSKAWRRKLMVWETWRQQLFLCAPKGSKCSLSTSCGKSMTACRPCCPRQSHGYDRRPCQEGLGPNTSVCTRPAPASPLWLCDHSRWQAANGSSSYRGTTLSKNKQARRRPAFTSALPPPRSHYGHGLLAPPRQQRAPEYCPKMGANGWRLVG